MTDDPMILEMLTPEDLMVTRADAMIRLAAAVDATKDREAKALLREHMAMIDLASSYHLSELGKQHHAARAKASRSGPNVVSIKGGPQ